MNCKYCKADCAHRGENREKECRGHIRMTNADRIRAMSDEELAELLRDTVCPVVQSDTVCEWFGNCFNCWLDWLKQPVKDGEDDVR